MDFHNIHMPVEEYAFSLPRPTVSIPLKTINHLSKVKFNGEGKIYELNIFINSLVNVYLVRFVMTMKFAGYSPSHSKEESRGGMRS